MMRLNGFRIGTCIPAGGQADVECLIWNHNERGALLEFPAGPGSLATFRLRCPELDIDETCRIIWQDGRECGVAYTARSD